MKKNKDDDDIILKTSFVYEGRIDERFINFLTRNLYKLKKPVCNKHYQVIGGTIKLDNVKIKDKKCCKTFYFFDKDDWKDSCIEVIKNKIEEQGDTLILSHPQFELCLLAIFEKHCDTDIDKKMLEKKLTKHINENKIYKDKYEHKTEIVEKIMLYLKEIINNEKHEYSIEKFEENLNHYFLNKQLHTNLIEYINHLKKGQSNGTNEI